MPCLASIGVSPARSSEVLPTPAVPVRAVTRAPSATTCWNSASHSRRRPKNMGAPLSSYGRRPRKGLDTTAPEIPLGWGTGYCRISDSSISGSSS